MKEEWKDIIGYEGIYQVSNLGNVRSLDKIIMRRHSEMLTVHGRILKPMHSKGYCYVRLNDKRSFKDKQIHRLVAQAFIPNPNNLPEINHKDEDKTNNRVDNLEWCTRKYNLNYGQRASKFAASMRGKLVGCRNPMYGKSGTFKGRKHSSETRQYLSKQAAGRVWINNKYHEKRVKSDEVQSYLELGYVKGRLTPWQSKHWKKSSN